MRYFKESEFVMGKENVFNKMDNKLIEVLDPLRESVGEPLFITSSFRDKEYNNSVGGSLRSQHLLRKAIDISCNNGTLRSKIVEAALHLGLSVGVSKTFIHIDCRDSQIVFSY